MKSIKYLFSLIAVISLFVCFSSVNASDAIVTTDTANHEFTISRTINGVSNTVTNNYTYTITADSSNLSGATGIPTGATISFNNETPASNKVTKTAKINFAGARFVKNGDYKYIVTESASSNASTYPVDTNNKYTIVISIRNSTSNIVEKTATIYGYSGEGASMTKLDDGSGPGSGTTLNYETTADNTMIEFTADVEGNMASIDEYFKIKVTINGNPGDTYTIEGQSYPGDDKQTVYTVGEDNYIYVKHGETVTIGNNEDLKEIPKGLTYNFVLQGAEEYETYINDSPNNSKSSGNLSTSNDNSNTITNKFEQDAITGKYLRVLPYVLIITIAIVAIIYLIVRKNKKSEL